MITGSAAALIRTEVKALIEVRTNRERVTSTFSPSSHLTVNNSHKDRWVHFSLLAFPWTHFTYRSSPETSSCKNYDYKYMKRRRIDFRRRGVRMRVIQTAESCFLLLLCLNYALLFSPTPFQTQTFQSLFVKGMARKMAAPLTEVHTMYDWRWFSRLSSSLCIFLFHCFVLFYCSLPFFKTSQHFCTTPPFFSPLVGGHSIYNHHWRQSVRGGGGGRGGEEEQGRENWRSVLWSARGGEGVWTVFILRIHSAATRCPLVTIVYLLLHRLMTIRILLCCTVLYCAVSLSWAEDDL